MLNSVKVNICLLRIQINSMYNNNCHKYSSSINNNKYNTKINMNNSNSKLANRNKITMEKIL